MENIESKEEIYNRAKSQHTLLDRRLQILLRKPYLTNKEELEVRVLKKKKLYYKDIMENLSDTQEGKEKD
jgi:hypothetical protein